MRHWLCAAPPVSINRNAHLDSLVLCLKSMRSEVRRRNEAFAPLSEKVLVSLISVHTTWLFALSTVARQIAVQRDRSVRISEPLIMKNSKDLSRANSMLECLHAL